MWLIVIGCGIVIPCTLIVGFIGGVVVLKTFLHLFSFKMPILYDKYDWCKELCDAIEEIKQSDDVVNIYLCKNGEYDNF
jgi:hypothetical protein